MSSVNEKCSICQKPLSNEKKREVTLSCRHTFHHECAIQRFQNSKSSDCPICRKKLALEQALTGGKAVDNKHGSSARSKSDKNDDNSGSSAPAGKHKPHSSSTYGDDSSGDEWKCSNCAKKNSSSASRCKTCGESRYSASGVKSLVESALDGSHGQKPQSSKHSQGSDYHHSDAYGKNDDEDDPPVNRQQWNRQGSTPEWTCDECEYDNRGSDAVCKNCRQGKQPKGESSNAARQARRSPSPVHHSAAASHSSSRFKSPAPPKPDYDGYSGSQSAYGHHSPAASHSSSKSKPPAYSKPDSDRDSSPDLPYGHHSSGASHSSSKSKPSGHSKPSYGGDSSPESPYSHPSPAASHSSSKSKPPGHSKPSYDRDSSPEPTYGHHSPAPSHSSSKSKPAGHSKPSYDRDSSPESPHGHHSLPKGKPHAPTPPIPVPVYISDFPLDIDDDHELEHRIRQRVEKSLRIEISDIKCYAKLGVGVMYVNGEQTRDNLIDDVGRVAWDPKDTKTMISFVGKLKLVSYIVFDMPKEKADFTFPTPEEVSRRWADVNSGQKPRICEQLNTQFPNIFRLVSSSLDKLINSLGHEDIKVKNQFAQIYFCGDCSFFEDLPKSITKDQLEQAVTSAMKQPHIPSTSLHIQLNKQTGSACVIAANKARKWATVSFIVINGKSIPKKNKLSCRLIVYPIPPTLKSHTITEHSEFDGKATMIKHSGESLLLEISDDYVFDTCIKRGVLRVGEHRLSMDIYTAANNPDGCDIDCDTWYEAEMLNCSKPDIMQFIADRDHFIFRSKWNAKIWLEQFQQATPDKFGGDFPKDPREQRGTSVDLLRHQLQMTVMLNTLASIRLGRYFIRDREVKLKLNKLKTIVYTHDSKLRRSDKMPTKTPFTHTKISVVGDDCVVAYENLIKRGKNPLLLNMASATSPGGGFRKGDGAQEENLFRRSDYFRSLDVGLDSFLPQSQRSERVRCTSEGREESLPEPHKMYPIDEFGAIYTSGLTFFRHSQDAGYEYLDKPIDDVCAIAMAAYRDPKLEGRLLSAKYAVGTRKKIENVFSIAHHHKHDSLVLSAFGCGAFRNPPGHIARLFYSVIEQYAGFFDTIVFAIIDDHNAGQRLNPEGNLKPFIDVLDTKPVEIIAPVNKPNTMFGPYRVSSDGSKFNDINIFDSNPCFYAAKCVDTQNSSHTRDYSHPPLCARAVIQGKCDLGKHFVHIDSFIHRKPCEYGATCRKIDDKKHAEEVEHPSYCTQKGACQDMKDDHLKQFRHVPLCDKGIKCMDYQKRIPKHCDENRHCQRRCQFGNNCIKFHDKDHIKEEQHPFPPPCPRTPFHCSEYNILSETADTGTVPYHIQQHCLDFAHVCRFGRSCANKIPLHQEKSIHIIRNLCPYDGKCNKLNQEEHLNSFTHKNVADIRRVCRAEKCTELHKQDHVLRFRHTRSHDNNGIVRYYSLNSGIDFVQNQCEGITRVLDYVKKQKWASLPSDTVPSEILNWFRTVRPVHRCNPVIFESILVHGHVMSRDYMENLKKPKFVATSVMQHSRIDRIGNLRIAPYAQLAKDYIIALVSAEFDKANFPPPDPVPGGDPTAVPVAAPGPRPVSADHASSIKAKEKSLSLVISSGDLDVLKSKAIEIAQASIKLHTNPAGIGHAPDKALGTDKRVFGILGPHLGHYYGDVFIVFKREILHHPDADYSMLAATTYGTTANAYKWCPWLGAAPADLNERIGQYHHSKLQASIPGHEYAIALQLMAITCLELKLKSMDIDLNVLIKRWLSNDSHRTIEAHLPQLIPVKYIDHIYMPQGIFDSLNQQTHRSMDALFKHCTVVTPHKFPSGDPMGAFGPQPASKERADYQNQVVKELLERCKRDSQNPPARPIEGAVITIPASNFTESFVLPLTISQARELHRVQHKKDALNDIAYIYWQAMNGDMMLVVSTEKLEATDDQKTDSHCLLCYIAPKSGSSDSYHEQTTYLNCGAPFKHHAFVNRNEFKAKSNTFHLGSNTDDLITYCLEIHRSTGRVVLRQAGSNAIYNHQEISYEFKNKKELDITKLEYVHVTADTKNVTVRNLIVCFEKQADLHPTFDKDFKKAAPTAAGGPPSPGGSSVKLCPDNVNCLMQYDPGQSGKDHISKYSHPCRFSELCRNKEPHLTHDPHRSPQCSYDEKCKKLTDPFHRAENRHTDLSDFLVPCRDQKKCSKNSDEHLMKYSHGEDVFKKKGAGSSGSDNPRPSCEYGSKCRNIDDSSHRAKYSHGDEAAKKKGAAGSGSDDPRSPCEYGSKCRNIDDSSHRAKYSHGDEAAKKKGAAGSGSDDPRSPCEYGSKCRNIGDASHRAKYSHK